MASGADAAVRARLVDEIRSRVEAVLSLTADVRAALVRADAEAIEDATARLQSVALEFRLLVEEQLRLGEPSPEVAAHEKFAGARRGLEQTIVRLAREAAVAGGLLERMVRMSRALLTSLGAPEGEAYTPGGRSMSYPGHGVRLQERA